MQLKFESMLQVAANKRYTLPLIGIGPAESPYLVCRHHFSTLWATNHLKEIIVKTFNDRVLNAVQADIWLMLA